MAIPKIRGHLEKQADFRVERAALLLALCSGLAQAQGRPPEVPYPAGSDTTMVGSPAAGALGKSADAYPDVYAGGTPRQGVSCEVALAASPAANGPVVLAWVDYRQGLRCAYASSQDGGTIWSAPIFVAPTSGGSTGDATVGVDDNGTFYGACQDYGVSQIRFSSSTNGGQTWAAWRNVQASPDKPWVAGARNGTVFLTWLNPGGFKRSTDGGQTWGSVISLPNVYHGTAIAPGNTGLVHVIYNAGNPLRYYRSADWGATLDAGRNLVTNMGTFCYAPCNPRQHPIVGGASDPTGQTVAAVWSSTMSGGDGNDDVWAIISRDGGNTWTNPIRVNSNTNASRQFQPWVAVDRYHRVHVVWTDMRNGNNAIFYANTLTIAFGTNVELTDATGSISTAFYGDYKGLGIQGNDVLSAWADSRNGDYDIYFSRGMGLASSPTKVLTATQIKRAWKTSAIRDIRGVKVGGGRPAPGKYMPVRKADSPGK